MSAGMLFPIGKLVATPAALDAMKDAGTSFIALICRHARGDFGNLCDEDRELNVEAVNTGQRILSSYDLATGKVWIITEHDRSATTILLPSEY